MHGWSQLKAFVAGLGLSAHLPKDAADNADNDSEESAVEDEDDQDAELVQLVQAAQAQRTKPRTDLPDSDVNNDSDDNDQDDDDQQDGIEVDEDNADNDASTSHAAPQLARDHRLERKYSAATLERPPVRKGLLIPSLAGMWHDMLDSDEVRGHVAADMDRLTQTSRTEVYIPPAVLRNVQGYLKVLMEMEVAAFETSTSVDRYCYTMRQRVVVSLSLE